MSDRNRSIPVTPTPVTGVLEYVLGADPAVIRGIARAVEQAINARGTLSLNKRAMLIQRAEQLGIKRFDANLIIAAVEQRTNQHPPSHAINSDNENKTPHHPPIWIKIATVLGIQACILTALIWLIW